METTSCQPSFLKSLLERPFTLLKLGSDVQKPVAVLAIQRYLSERVNGPPNKLDSYSYDVTLTDGIWRAKFFLHPDLNYLVFTNTLKSGIDVIINQCSFVHDERRLAYGYVCISELECVPGRSAILLHIQDVKSLPVLAVNGIGRNMLLHCNAPLELSRKHYLPLWNNEDPEGEEWVFVNPSAEVVLDASQVVPLRVLGNSAHSPSRSLPLLVKIIHKSRVRYFGKIGLKVDYPYQAYFEVADHSGTMSMVLWNELCLQFYNRLRVGTVLFIQNYVLKQSYSNRSRPQMNHHKMINFTGVEISLNSSNPASIIIVIPPNNVLPQWRLPSISYRFVTTSDLKTMANNSTCDIIGLVTFVGRIERIRSKNIVPQKFWTFRWIHAIDETSRQPFILELFSTSESENFYHISPMTILVCTQMRLCRLRGSLTYLTSSSETEAYITGHHKNQPYVKERRVRVFVKWTKTLTDEMILPNAAVGGRYSYPPQPMREINMASGSTEGQIPLVSLADLRKEFKIFQYRETKTVAIQGWLTAVSYMRTLKTPQANATKGNVKEQVVPNQSNHPSADSAMAEHATEIKRRRISPKKEISSAEELQSQKDRNALSWERSTWSMERQELSEHFRCDGLHPDSFFRTFSAGVKNQLTKQAGLQPSWWTPESTAGTDMPTTCPGYYQLTILDLNKQIAVDIPFLPVVNSTDPRFFGLPLEQHNNSLLSILLSGHVCAFRTKGNLPEPKEIFGTAHELENTKVVCILDLCHLGGQEMEILINKMYKITLVASFQ